MWHTCHGERTLHGAAALREMQAEEVPEFACTDREEWGFEIQELSDSILWDADYECDDLFLD